MGQFPVLLDKSQLPDVKQKKARACDKFIEEYEKKTGTKMTKDQLFKKVNNMKSTIKTRADVKRTGNKPILLTDWEQDFLVSLSYH